MDMKDKIPKNKKVILFDGICNLCNASVLKVIENDKKNIFVFASLQSKIGKEITTFLNIDTSKIDSIILFTPLFEYDIKSTAALKITKHFGGFWKLLQVFWIFPEAFRNLFYDFIAKNRYKWYGKKEQCMIPIPALKNKFLD